MEKKELPIEDTPNLQLAKQGEKSGKVKPFPGGKFESLNFLLTTLKYKLTQSLHGPESLLPKQQAGEDDANAPEK